MYTVRWSLHVMLNLAPVLLLPTLCTQHGTLLLKKEKQLLLVILNYEACSSWTGMYAATGCLRRALIRGTGTFRYLIRSTKVSHRWTEYSTRAMRINHASCSDIPYLSFACPPVRVLGGH